MTPKAKALYVISAAGVAAAAIAGTAAGARWPLTLDAARRLASFTDKFLAVTVALAAYLSNTALTLKLRRGEYGRERAKERQTPGRADYLHYLEREMTHRTDEIRWLILPDATVVALALLLAFRLVAWGTDVGEPAWLDGLELGLLAATAVTLLWFHVNQYASAVRGRLQPVPPPPPATTPRAADYLDGLRVEVELGTGRPPVQVRFSQAPARRASP